MSERAVTAARQALVGAIAEIDAQIARLYLLDDHDLKLIIEVDANKEVQLVPSAQPIA